MVEAEKAGIHGWIRAIRHVPANCRVISDSVPIEGFQAGACERIIGHNRDDLLFAREWETPKVLVFHSKPSTEIALRNRPVDKSDCVDRIAQLFATIRNLGLFYISEAKRFGWGFEGGILLPGVGAARYDG